MLEEHIAEELGRQLDYYVDAYRKVRDVDVQLGAEADRISALNEERAEAEALRDAAQEAVNALVENLPEEDEAEVMAIVNERLSPLVGLMVL